MSKPVIVLNELTKAMENIEELKTLALLLNKARFSALSAPTGRENLLPSAP